MIVEIIGIAVFGGAMMGNIVYVLDKHKKKPVEEPPISDEVRLIEELLKSSDEWKFTTEVLVHPIGVRVHPSTTSMWYILEEGGEYVDPTSSEAKLLKVAALARKDKIQKAENKKRAEGLAQRIKNYYTSVLGDSELEHRVESKGSANACVLGTTTYISAHQAYREHHRRSPSINASGVLLTREYVESKRISELSHKLAKRYVLNNLV